ncbi:protein-disulfide reductase DsbD family protein [Aquisediminimonas sediminicola]|uniref:protein-disulfide reductase DsbD family protein n=1 Tax=Alteraquisediminimonas sediminicola TaxID=2676787 RepID=UPI001C8CF618|nr:protein-disulfide reductase DsbD domain-containing protein [Aquisediminimonas sediminicola]
MRTQLCRWLILLGIMAAATVAHAQQRMVAQLVAEQTSPAPGTTTGLAIDLQPATGWHGYWLNPGDAGTKPQIDWTLPNGVTIAALRYPVPQTLLISGLMNHVYEQDYALLTRLTLSPDIAPGTILPIRAHARWLVCSDTLCVPEQADLALDLTASQSGTATSNDPRFDGWRAKLPRPLGAQARFEVKGDLVRIAIPYPATTKVTAPHFFALTTDLIDYAKPQHFGRHQDQLIVELPKAGFFTPQNALHGLLAIGPDQGLEIEAIPGVVPAITTEETVKAMPTTARIAAALGLDQPTINSGPAPHIAPSPFSLWLALGGAILGGLLLNLMPCVFPILSLKAMSLIRAGANKHEAQREGLAYLAGAVIGTTALGGLLLLLRATGEQAGWAFQLQYPTTILVLYALMALLTANLAGWVRLPAIVTGQKLTQREGAWGALFTGMLAAFVATPCTGPFLGAALGAALVLPSIAALGIFAGLGLGIALPFVAIGFIPALRTRLPKPGGWMERVKHWLALPMALTALALLWLLWRQAALPGLAAASAMTLLGAIFIWRRQGYIGLTALALGFAASFTLGLALPTKTGTDNATIDQQDAVPFNEAALATLRQSNTPVFLYFTADWCITCKVNEAAAIDRADVRAAFKAKGIKVMIGDWTRGDPAITRFLESQGRSGVPLYLYYPAKGATPQTLPQLLTPDMLLALE